MNKLVNVKFHGNIWGDLKANYNLAVSSVGEAIYAIDTLNKRKLTKQLLGNDKKNIKYRVLINGRDFVCQEPLSLEKPETITNSELVMIRKNLQNIDIVPVLEGADGALNILTIVLGVILIVVGFVIFPGTQVLGLMLLKSALVMGGLGLVVAGVINLLSSPPKFEDFRTIEKGGKSSYLFNGPENTVGEGGPVPMGYGRLIVGSHTVVTTYNIVDIESENLNYPKTNIEDEEE